MCTILDITVDKYEFIIVETFEPNLP